MERKHYSLEDFNPIIDLSSTLDYFSVKALISDYGKFCSSYSCKGCPYTIISYSLGYVSYSEDIKTSLFQGKPCYVLESSDIKAAIEVAKEWVFRNKPKTRLSLLLERYPQTPLNATGIPDFCVNSLGYDEKDCEGLYCETCWRKLVIIK